MARCGSNTHGRGRVFLDVSKGRGRKALVGVGHFARLERFVGRRRAADAGVVELLRLEVGRCSFRRRVLDGQRCRRRRRRRRHCGRRRRRS